MATRVLVANAEKSYHNQLIDILKRSGYLVIAEQNESKGALQAALKIEPDVIIIDDNLPGGSLSLARDIYDHNIAPVLIATTYSEKDMIEIAKAAGVFGMLLKPIHETSILPAIETAINIFNNIKSLERDIKKLKQEIEQRKLVERAKGLLMDKKGFSEGEAFRYLQKVSMDKCVPISKVAKNIIAKLQVK
ncbi:ANTAR domain-containing response regulator [Desulfotruncus alcoholivorax]|uniref:ANTAR domain-containing response regulator n=1 Tax=Desulfotruncus alcoholivorax TaxID=265477 RepID=UPI0004870AD5|nr:ANTAR domain-containing protein [Desulfotruncus alcoholivorax]